MSLNLSENAKKIMQSLRTDGDGVTGPVLAKRVGIAPRSVTGTVNSLVKKQLVYRMQVDAYKVIMLTDEGRTCELDNPVEENGLHRSTNEMMSGF